MPTARIPLVGSFNQRTIDARAVLALNEKICITCGTVKQHSLFNKCSRYNDGLHRVCSECKKAYALQYYKKNRVRALVVAKEYGLRNKDKLKDRWKVWSDKNRTLLAEAARKRRNDNPEKTRTEAARWRDQHREHLRGLHRCYASMKRQIIGGQLISHAWVHEIKQIYMDCPKGFHVDHIIPLRGKGVNGLHVPWNLQYLPALENIRKGNRYANS